MLIKNDFSMSIADDSSGVSTKKWKNLSHPITKGMTTKDFLWIFKKFFMLNEA